MTVLRAFLAVGLGWLMAGCSNPQPQRQTIAAGSVARNQHQVVSIPGGAYTVGGLANPLNPRRTVHLKTFRISDAETTNEQFARFIKAIGYVTDAERRGYGLVSKEGMPDWAWDQVAGACWRQPMGAGFPKAEEMPNHPVTQISGADAEAYCRWVGGRLPTLDEWEVAARAGSLARWPWGDRFDPSRANIWNGESHLHNTREDGWVYTSPVRTFPPNAWGLYDVIGNVFEYCSDLPGHDTHAQKSTLISGRGGSWWCSTSACNFFNLEDIGTMDRHGTLANQGFRVCFDHQSPRIFDSKSSSRQRETK